MTGSMPWGRVQVRAGIRFGRFPRVRILRVLALGILGPVSVLAGCATGVHPGAPPAAAAHPASAPGAQAAPSAPSALGARATAPSCDPRASLRPSGPLPAARQMPPGSYMDTILRRGLLRVGTSQDTYLFGSRNSFTGDVEGFDVDMARQVAQAIFGDPDRIQIVIIPYKERVSAVVSRQVDLVAETMTINCERLKSVDFSTVYYDAGQKVLIAKNSKAKGIEDLGGKRVCAAAGSTSLANLAKVRTHPIGVAAPTQADCLVRFQQGTVDAISTDDTILAGLAVQDPYAKVVGRAFTEEPYGLATPRAHPEFTRFVNAVLERVRRDGTWVKLYDKWPGRLTPGRAPAPPAARYRD